ncbi:MAG: F0F1 ATP synthase subunit A [Ekhidna sp.]|uniref:F0F1 ATP synthase subunit A n=1 Tax=Ekhidna sp. TaxID=2608089 RepID=UPI0032ED57BC
MKTGSTFKQFNLLKINKFFAVLLLAFPGVVFAGGGSKEGEDERFDPTPLINHHISDSHVWEIYHGLTVHLPVIIYSEEKGLDIFSSSNFYNEHHETVPYNGYVMDHDHITLESGAHVYDLSITKNVLFLFIDAFLLILVFLAVARGYKKNVGRAPRGIQSFFEPIIIFIRDDIAKENIGHKYERFMPYLLTVFFFIWFGNMLGLLPGAANMTGNISVTLTLAVLTLVTTLFSGRKTYWLHIVDPLGKSMPWAGKLMLYLILWPVEIIGIFTKPFSLMIRLFANITAGHILILSIISLAFIFESLSIGVVGALFATVMNMLELFVAVLQAYVFTLLSALYFGQAVEEHH